MEYRENGENTTLECRYDSFLITEKQKRKMDILFVMNMCDKPLTALEIARYLYNYGKVDRIDRNYVSPRMTEMCIDGTVEPVGKKYCPAAGRKVTAFKIRKAV